MLYITFLPDFQNIIDAGFFCYIDAISHLVMLYHIHRCHITRVKINIIEHVIQHVFTRFSKYYWRRLTLLYSMQYHTLS